MDSIKLKNIEGIRPIIDLLHHTREFNGLQCTLIRYNDSEAIEILVHLKNKKELNNLTLIVTGINAALRTHTSIYTDSEIILE